MRLVRLGTDYGGWVIPANAVREDSVVWCVGAGEDISFDLALIDRYGCRVHCIDPTPRAIEHVQVLTQRVRDGEPMPINGKPDQTYARVTPQIMGRLQFLPFGLYDRDTILRFYAPKRCEHVSHSAVNLQGTATFFEAQCRSPRSLMNELGQERIDLLKLDIEGAEHVVIDHLLDERILPSVLCIELDYAARGTRRRAAVARVWRLCEAGYRLAWHRDWNVTLVREDAPPSRMRRLSWGVSWLLGSLPRSASARSVDVGMGPPRA
jgi:FkbM family methyltransferase